MGNVMHGRGDAADRPTELVPAKEERRRRKGRWKEGKKRETRVPDVRTRSHSQLQNYRSFYGPILALAWHLNVCSQTVI